MTSTLLTLYLLPVLYPWFSPNELNRPYTSESEPSSRVEVR